MYVTSLIFLRLLSDDLRLGRFIFEVGKLVAKACEGFGKPLLFIPPRYCTQQKFMNRTPHDTTPRLVSSQASSRTASIADLIANSQCNKARLLHYFPPSTKSGDEVVADDDACGMHLDHSILTGLCESLPGCYAMCGKRQGLMVGGFLWSLLGSAMYLSHEEPGEPKVVPPPDANAGLWICPRRKGAEPVKVSIPADCLGQSCSQRVRKGARKLKEFLPLTQLSRRGKHCKSSPREGSRPRPIMSPQARRVVTYQERRLPSSCNPTSTRSSARTARRSVSSRNGS
jgi:hypothetical protein